MMSKEHRKHSDLKRPAYGNYSRNEWAITGAPCNVIQQLSAKLITALSGTYQVAYIDAKHEDEEAALLPGMLAAGASSEYIVHSRFHQLALPHTPNSFEARSFFSSTDLVLVNGNHQQARSQVLIIDERKRSSVFKKLSQLNNIELFLLSGDSTEIYDFVRDVVPGWKEVPVYRMEETEKITAFFRNKLSEAMPVINGVVLAGGKSMRMGSDKSAMNWHGKEQKYYLADILQECCNEVYISCRPDQVPEIAGNYKPLPDTFTGLGPYGAILSAFRAEPDKAWLVVACDLPILTPATLQQLVLKRNPSAVATTFQNNWDGHPEPLITIWEPKSYMRLLSFLAQGYSCPRKVLINSEIQLLPAVYADELMNVNTREDAEHARQILKNKNKEPNAS